MLELLAIFVAGVWAGGVNVVVGSGTLVTFPTLLLFGYSPITANISNNIGLVFGGLTGTYGYRHELQGNGSFLRRMSPASVLGALTGAGLLLVLPADAFKAIVPVLIALGVIMVVIGPSMQRRAARRRVELGESPEPGRQILLTIGIFAMGIYGGYFGAAQGVLLVGLLGVLLNEGLQRITALKNVLTTIVNAVAALTFIVFAWDQIDWKVVGLIGSGALVGGYLGARVGRRLPPQVLRTMIVVIGIIAIVKILFFD